MDTAGQATTDQALVYALWHEYTATVNAYQSVDFPRLVGVFSTRAAAEVAAATASTLPGFRGDLGVVEDVSDLVVDTYALDEVHWTSGFVTIDSDEEFHETDMSS